MELTWHRFRTSSPRTFTSHHATSEFGRYDIVKVGKVYVARFFETDVEIEKFIGAYTTLKEAKREAGYDHGRRNFNKAIMSSSPRLWREDI